MEFSRIKPGKAARKAREIYEEAFPPEEQMPFGALLRASLIRRGIDFWGLFEGGELCAFSIVSSDEGIAYVLYLAVDRDKRSCGYGGEMLDFIRDRYSPRDICLDIEPVEPGADNFEQRRRRKDFYLRNGLSETGLTLVEDKARFELLKFGDSLDAEALVRLIKRRSFGLTRVEVVPMR